jgi:hypothetical protein
VNASCAFILGGVLKVVIGADFFLNLIAHDRNPPHNRSTSHLSHSRCQITEVCTLTISIPIDSTPGDSGQTLRDLISRIVRLEVQAFHERQAERRLTRYLSTAQLEAGLEKGKVDSGGRDLDQKVDPEAAIATALQAFEDGIYLVVLDGVEQKELDREIFVRPDSRITFIRLALLAGG